ncbi:methyl-accepting chemotaxis protein [Paenibacillus chitinolyticus]|uniref:methyl-accepting chemotaxis protein n=1 Tax=Paenibacillus chitinolyticus TaxID=79263 RepID=UPI0038671FA0
MKYLKRSVTAKMITMMAALVVVLCALIMTLTYLQQRGDYYSRLKSIERVVELGWEQQLPFLTKAMDQMKSTGKPDAAAAELEAIRTMMEHYVKDGDMSNVALYYPEEKTADGKTALTVVAANETLDKAGLKPLTDYTFSDQYTQAFETVKKTGGQGVTSVYTDQAGEWVTILSPVTDEAGKTMAYVAIDFDYGTLSWDLNKRLLMSLAFYVGVALLFAWLLGIFSRRILKPIGELSRLSLEVAEGNLAVAIPVRSEDEFGTLARNFNAMTASIHSLILGIRESSDQVSHAAEVLDTNAKQTTQATHQIATAIEQVASGAERQLQSTQESSNAMEEMATGIQRIAESAGYAAQSSESASEEAARGNGMIQHNVKQMSRMNDTVQRSVESINQLAQLSEEIGGITALISDIANQTNLLALNAAIEAARAGEHGRGFSVVSDEIRKLAEQSRQSSDKIAELVVTIRAGTGQAVGTMSQTAEEVTEMTKFVSESGEAFQRIVNHMDELAKQILEVSSSSQQMSAGTEEVAASISELSHMNQQTVESSQTVAASSEEQLASMEDISASAGALSDMSRELKQSISRFKL